MPSRSSWFATFVRVAFVTCVVCTAGVAPAAVEYRCGPGGKPNKTKKVCDCPAGKTESTDAKGVSSCVTSPSPASKPTASPPPPPPAATPQPTTVPPPVPEPTTTAPPVAWPSPPPVIPSIGACANGMSAIPGGTLKFDKDQVTLSPYCLDRTEVTVQAYGACVASGKCSEPTVYVAGKSGPYMKACNWKVAGREKHPVNCVTFEQATNYCAFAGRRLPTGPEFAWAYRNGDKKWEYPWGNEQILTARLNACGKECEAYRKGDYMPGSANGSVYDDADPFAETAPVASFPATAFGLFDMAGNVGEWNSTLGHYEDNGSGYKLANDKHLISGGTYLDRGKQSFWVIDQHYGRGDHDMQPIFGFRCARAM